MKFNNIATLCDEYDIKISNKISRLENYSRQNHVEFNRVKDYSSSEIISELNKIRTQYLKTYKI